MAVAPLFVADLATLKKALRMSGIQAGSDAEAMFEQAVEEVRLFLYDRLSAGTVAQLVATGYVQNPTTPPTILRAHANAAEILAVRRLLLERFPLIVVDGSNRVNQDWNDEAPFRAVAQAQRQVELDRVKDLLERHLSILTGVDQEELSVFASNMGPDPDTIDLPGATVFPWRRGVTPNLPTFPQFPDTLPEGDISF